jgi:hypothetical protein
MVDVVEVKEPEDQLPVIEDHQNRESVATLVVDVDEEGENDEDLEIFHLPDEEINQNKNDVLEDILMYMPDAVDPIRGKKSKYKKWKDSDPHEYQKSSWPVPFDRED